MWAGFLDTGRLAWLPLSAVLLLHALTLPLLPDAVRGVLLLDPVASSGGLACFFAVVIVVLTLALVLTLVLVVLSIWHCLNFLAACINLFSVDLGAGKPVCCPYLRPGLGVYRVPLGGSPLYVVSPRPLSANMRRVTMFLQSKVSRCETAIFA
ncbi:MAG: hypothetical protein ABIV13_01925 [Fimbriimonadales bacterium]